MPVECESERGSDTTFTVTVISTVYPFLLSLLGTCSSFTLSVLLSEDRIILYGFMDEGKENVVVLGCCDEMILAMQEGFQARML
jgi:hypothetical protein